MRSLTLLFASAALAACSSYDPDLGPTPFLCGDTDPVCPDGYSCQDMAGQRVCVSDSGGGVDGGQSGFQCADDGALETSNGTSNDTIQSAYAIQLTSMNSIKIGPLGICPAGDKDTYKIEITTANSNLEVITTWDSGMPVSVAILNGGGTTIAPSTSSAAMAQRAYAANLPVGTYYAQAYAAATTQNNYRIEIKVTP